MSKPTVWEQLAAQKDKWIGGTLIEEADGFLSQEMTTTITDVVFYRDIENDCCRFGITGEDWHMRANINYIGIAASKRGDGFMIRLTFYGGNTWHMLKPKEGGK